MIQTVGIIGFGAIGIKYALEFQNTLGMDNVLIIADRARIDRYRADGVFINGEKHDFRYLVDTEAPEVDLLLFMTKYTGLEAAIESARKACGQHTIVMSFLNGVSSEQMILERLAPQHLLYCSVQGMDATKEGNRLFYQRSGYIAFGSAENRRTAEVEAVQELLDACGMAYKIPEDIRHQLWSKWMLNCGVNQVCALFGVSYGQVQPGGKYRSAMAEAMEEARSVANAEGIALTREELDYWIGVIDTLAPEGEPSMRQDTKAGRRTEVGLFAGVVCPLGKKHGIATPWNDRFLSELP